MTLLDARRIAASFGCYLTRRDGEYRINLVGGSEATAYYTSDLEDAVNTARAMAMREFDTSIVPACRY
jgi:hypothetical protein